MKWDEKGLAVAIAQHVDTGAVLMQGFANRDALASTISSKKATFYSRSRSKLWTKGETSMNYINICDIFLDCDRDSVSFDKFKSYCIICFHLCMITYLNSDKSYHSFTDTVPWSAGWPLMPHWVRNLLLYICF